MHGSILRGSDFRITQQREEVSHARFFRDLSATDRVGVFAPADDAGETLDAILDRAINVLVVPAGSAGTTECAPAQMASARRTIRRCYTYSATGATEQPTLAVACGRAEPAEWARAVINSLPPDDSAVRSHWLRVVAGGSIPQQSFSEVSLEQALALIR